MSYIKLFEKVYILIIFNIAKSSIGVVEMDNTEIFAIAAKKSIDEITKELSNLKEDVLDEIEDVAQSFCYSRNCCEKLGIPYDRLTAQDEQRARYAAYLMFKHLCPAAA